MKILWITQIYPWTSTLANLLATRVELLLLCPQASPVKTNICNCNIHYINITEEELTCTMMTSAIAEKYLSVILQYKPDIIHIHGSERNYGQLQNYLSEIPIVIGIQGIMKGCLPFVTNYLEDEVLRPHKTLKNFLGRGGVQMQKKILQKRCKKYELDILQHGQYFFCRTNWDKAWIQFNNPKAKIFQGEELLREPFYLHSGKWNIHEAKRRNIFMPSGFNPLKGLHIALKALALLKTFYPDIMLTVPGLPQHILSYGKIKSRIIGEEYINYCISIIEDNQLKKNISLLPRLDAEGMVKEMINANVFLSPSSIDNSPNAVGEAMMIGVPIVSTPVGGVLSILRDEESCLFAPAGDEFLMAYQIKRIFEDDALATNLSTNARKVASQRHNKQQTLDQYINAYQAIINSHKQKSQ